MKEKISKIFNPNKIVGFILFNLALILLIYVFNYHLEETALAYISYALSTYALIIFCLWFFKICKLGSITFKKTKLYSSYQDNNLIITKTKLYFSLSINFLYGLFNLITGIYYISWWFIIFGIYYLLLCLMKFSVVKNIENQVDNIVKNFKKLKLIGIILLLLNLILSGIIVLIIEYGQVINYNGVIIYIVALYDFILIITAIINVVKYRNNNNPILIAQKCINLTVAMVAMISLEVAMIYQFGNNDYSFKSVMTGSMGLVICIINSIMSIYMITKANKNLKHLSR